AGNYVSGSSFSGTVGGGVATLKLNKRTGASCVLDTITVASSAATTVGTLPAVVYDGNYSAAWYTEDGQAIGVSIPSGTTDIYSKYCFVLNNGDDDYVTLTAALAAAADGDTITLLESITESAVYTVTADKTVTIDGGGYTVTAPNSTADSVALTLDGDGTIILKDITLQGGATAVDSNYESIGLLTSGGSSVTVQNGGNVSAVGGASANSRGVISYSSGTVNVTSATGGNASAGTVGFSIGAFNKGSGTLNVASATGGTAKNNSLGANNYTDGTINVTTATGGTAGGESIGAVNIDNEYAYAGTVNVTTATGGTADGDSSGVVCWGGSVNVTNAAGGRGTNNSNGVLCFMGTVNVNTATCDISAAAACYVNNDSGTLNAGSYASTGTGTTVPTVLGTVGGSVATLTLNKRSGATCVLDSITIAGGTAATKIGTLPTVFYNGAYSTAWFTDSALGTASLFSGTSYTAGTANNLYSCYYTSGGSIGGGSVGGGGSTKTDEEPGEEAGNDENTWNNPFPDVPSDAWYYDAVRFASQKGLMNGTGNGFEPGSRLTRGMFVTVLFRLSGDTGSHTNGFTDIKTGAWYENAAAWAAANGIAGGIGNNLFSLNGEITREQLAVMLYNFAKYMGYDVSAGESGDISSYNDSGNASDYALAALKWAVQAGILNGDDLGNLNPEGSATRAETAAILMRFMEFTAV
ncbi:MAG: S-layer homology domain-containing protein, partial [Clostridia bacterium]|nr:S-layer homology domain-containing protein [Clostridia bacterium]